MSQHQDIHWAQNENRLEQYVLGRLESHKIAELESHLRECDECRKLVTLERDLVSGIRRSGRDSLKQRLAQRIDQRKGRNATWYRIAGVAAGIVLLVTVGVYDRWFTGGEPSKGRKESANRIEKHAEQAKAVSPENPTADSKRKIADEAKRSPAGKEERIENLAAGAPEKTHAGVARVGESQVDRLKDLNAAGGRIDAQANDKRDRFAGASAGTTVAATWIQGTIIKEQDQNRPAMQAIAANAEEEQATLRKGKEQKQVVSKTEKVQAAGMASPPVVITQQPVSALPSSQRAQQQGAFSVQTLLQKDPNGLRMTVFLDSLLSTRELRQAHAQPVGEDSIILNLGNQRVGYKLPPGWGGQGVQQTKKLK